MEEQCSWVVVVVKSKNFKGIFDIIKETRQEGGNLLSFKVV